MRQLLNNYGVALIAVMALIAAVAFVGGCATQPERMGPTPPAAKAGASQEAKFAASEQEAYYVGEIEFAKGSSALSKKAEKSIRELVTRARARAAIDEVKTIAWADAEYPSREAKSLGEAEIELAKRRNEELKKFLESVEKGVSVEAFNMAERPNALGRLFRTEDARVKGSLEAAGIPNGTAEDAKKTVGKAARAVVMVVLKK